MGESALRLRSLIIKRAGCDEIKLADAVGLIAGVLEMLLLGSRYRRAL